MPASQPIFNRPNLHATPLVLALALAAIHLWTTTLDWRQVNQIYGAYAFIPADFDAFLKDPGQWQGLRALLTHAFLHGDWVHLAANAFSLVVIGDLCVRAMGTTRFLVLYLLSAAGGALMFWVVATLAPSGQGFALVVGASGAVFGLLGALLRLRFDLMGAARWRWLGGVLLQLALLNLLLDFALGGRLAWEAHLGGLIVGWLLTPWATAR